MVCVARRSPSRTTIRPFKHFVYWARSFWREIDEQATMKLIGRETPEHLFVVRSRLFFSLICQNLVFNDTKPSIVFIIGPNNQI